MGCQTKAIYRFAIKVDLGLLDGRRGAPAENSQIAEIAQIAQIAQTK
jgi:hypothetical protein